MDECDAAQAVALAMELTIADPAAFVSNPESQSAVAAGVATAASVHVGAIGVEISAARRLEENPQRSRLLQGTVHADVTIYAADADSVAALHVTVGAIVAGAMATSLNDALTAAGVDGAVVVASLTAAVAPAPSEMFPDTSGDGEGDVNSMAFKSSCSSMLLVAIAALLCHF